LEVLHIFDALSNNDIRFQSVDVSSLGKDSPPPSDDEEPAAEAKNEEQYKWRQIVERERRGQQGLWREKLYQKLFSNTTDDSATLELPQIWAVTEYGLNGAPDSALRVPVCKVLACTAYPYLPFFLLILCPSELCRLFGACKTS
jgi:hypothetical protein